MPTSERLHYAWVVLTVGTLVVFGALGLARFGYTIVLPAMQSGLDMGDTGAGLLATANLAGYLALSLIGGALASRFGPRRVTAIGMTLVGLGMILTGASNTLGSAVLWRAVTGLGSGASNVPAMALMSAWFGARRRGFASGIAVAGSSIGLILLGPLVPWILSSWPEDGWRFSWYLFGGVAIALAIISYALLRDDPSEKHLKPLGGESQAPPAKEQSRSGLRWSEVYTSRRVWHLGLVYAAFGFSYITYMTFFVRYLEGEIGYTREAAGSLFMIMGWFSLACGLIWGTLSDRIGRRAALVLVYLIHALAFSLFVIWPRPAGLTLSAVLYGLTAWSIPAIMAATCGDALGPRLAPAALGFITLFFGIGQAIAPSIAGSMAEASGSFKGALLLAAAIALVGAFGSLLIRPSSHQGRTAPVETAGDAPG
ncbi:MAG: MFS transporter [Anaerolineales bacterium]|jgi:MFS family permease